MSASTTTDCGHIDEHFDRLFAEPAAELPSAVRAHLERCPRCQRLHRWITGEAATESDTGRLAEALRNRIAGDLKPVRPLPATPVLALQFLAVILAVKAAYVLWKGPGAVAHLSVLQLVLVVLAFGSAAVLLAISLSWQMVPGTRQRVPVSVLLGAIAGLFPLLILLVYPWGDPRTDNLTSACTWFGVGVAVPAALIAFLLARRGAPLNYVRFGASLGAASGLLGVMVLQIHCTRLQASHYLVWHGLVLLIGLCGGLAAGAAAQAFADRSSTSR